MSTKSIITPPPATSQQMTGSVALWYFIVQGPTPDLQFTQTEIDTVKNKMQDACLLLQQQNNFQELSFIVKGNIQTITAIPNNGPCTNQETCEAVFRDPVLTQNRLPSGYDGVVSLVQATKTNYKTDWAFAVWIVKYPVFNEFYTRGVEICFRYNDPNNIRWIQDILSTQICQVFGAVPEGLTTGCNCDPSGIYNVPNNNCNSCKEYDGFIQEPCNLIYYKQQKLCSWTKGAIGWYNPAPYGGETLCLGVSTNNYLQTFYIDKTNYISYIQQDLNGRSLYRNLHFELKITSADYLPNITTAPAVAQQYNTAPALHASHLIFSNNAGEIIRLIFNPTQTLDFTVNPGIFENLTALTTPTPTLCSGSPSIAYRWKDNSFHVTYRDVNDDIAYIFIQGSVGQYYNLSSVPNSTKASWDPKIICDLSSTGGGVMRIFYPDINRDICEFVGEKSTWNYQNITKNVVGGIPGAMFAEIAIAAVFLDNYFEIMVVYRNLNDELACYAYSGNWIYYDLKSASGAPLMGNSALSVYRANIDDTRIVYNDSDWNIIEIYFNTSLRIWEWKNLTKISNSTPDEAARAPKIIGFNKGQSVINVDGKRNKVNLVYNTSWNYSSWKL